MRARAEPAFGALDVPATPPRTSQKSGGASGSATESRPSGRSPRRHSTKPPKIERAAEPEPRRASAESAGGSRSEEHTSELQSQSNLVCRLLLEKKKSP